MLDWKKLQNFTYGNVSFIFSHSLVLGFGEIGILRVCPQIKTAKIIKNQFIF
jgi:hypothetical protein